MFAFTAASIVALAAVSSVNAQAANTTAPATANATAIALVEAQYNASGFDTALPNSQSFGIPLNATALLTVTYGDVTIENGSPYTAAQVANKPRIVATPASENTFTANETFTLMLADASAVGQPDAEGDYRHYLANSVPVTEAEGNYTVGNGTVITSYAGPGPLVGSGVHRYAWLLFQQPSNFSAPANLSTPGVSPGHWSVQSYVDSSNLGNLIAASFFTVVNEADSTASAVPTSSIDVATLQVASTTAAAAASGAASSGVAGAAASPSSNTGAATSNGIAKAAAAVVALAGAVVIFA